MRRVLGRLACLLLALLLIHIPSGLWDPHQRPLDQVLALRKSGKFMHEMLLFVPPFLRPPYVLVPLFL